MSSAFHGRTGFNEDIASWDVSNVTDMHRMFGDAESFNQYIGEWNTSSVIEMSLMFDNANSFSTAGELGHIIGGINACNVQKCILFSSP